MDDNLNRRSHWPIYNIVSLEMIKSVVETIRGEPKKEDDKVVYFLDQGGESFEKIRERR